MNIKIATGAKCTSKTWKNTSYTWDDFVKRLSRTTKTTESMSEYINMTKRQRDNIKDVGGFVGGTLKNGSRKAQNVINRSIITLDMDFAPIGFKLESTYEYVMYSTHSHTPDNPRYRLVIILSEPISPDKYQPIARKLGELIGMDYFDDSTYQAHRLMYWPSTPQDIDYEFIYNNTGIILNPNEILKLYGEGDLWKDASLWPVSKRVQKVRNSEMKKQGDPLEKDGVIGAFCRTYDIHSAISTFLSDIYSPCAMADRYTYVNGSTAAGVVIYDDKFAYSNHATDPASGKLCNAWDLVRIHKFGELDDNLETDLPANRLPSFTSMRHFAVSDQDTKKTLLIEKINDAKLDFAEEVETDPDDNEWLSKLEVDSRGRAANTLVNMSKIITHDPSLKGIAYNEHRDEEVLTKNTPWRKVTASGCAWSDSDDANLRLYIEGKYGIWSPGKYQDALIAVSRQRTFHPVRDYLDNLPVWDGVERLDRLLIDYLGADDNIYTKAVTRKTLVAAVARIYKPGIKFDSVLVLNGLQGIGKSTLFKRLAGEWFNDSLSLMDTRDKTAPEKLQGYWILEIGELAGMKKADIEVVKAFITREKDIYRPSYGRRTVEHIRQCIIVASTNAENGFLRDTTGNRRFWPVAVQGYKEKAPWDIDGVEQIWAEAKHYFAKGEPLFLTGDVQRIAEEVQRGAMETDEREGLIVEYLDKLLPENWDAMDMYERRSYVRNETDPLSPIKEGKVKRQKVCTLEIWCELFGKEPGTMKRQEAYELNAIMTKIDGWERNEKTRHSKVRFPIYGIQKAYFRK